MAAVTANQISNGGGSSRQDAPVLRATLASRLAPSLPAPIAGESVVALRKGPLILGGLDSPEASVSGVFQLDGNSGRLSEVGSLSGPLHDAAAAVLGDRVLVFGGGTEDKQR